MTLAGAQQAREQREQLDRYLKWVAEEGGVEGPVRLDTYMRPEQRRRIKWLIDNCTGTILEVGASWGFVLAAVGGQTGIDINPANVALAKILAPSRDFYVGDARKLDFPDASFDTVVLAEVLEHLPFEDVPKALAEARRVAGATILITLPIDEQHAPSMKHQWTLSAEHQDAIIDELRRSERHGRGTYLNDGHFVCIKETLCESSS